MHDGYRVFCRRAHQRLLRQSAGPRLQRDGARALPELRAPVCCARHVFLSERCATTRERPGDLGPRATLRALPERLLRRERSGQRRTALSPRVARQSLRPCRRGLPRLGRRGGAGDRVPVSEVACAFGALGSASGAASQRGHSGYAVESGLGRNRRDSYPAQGYANAAATCARGSGRGSAHSRPVTPCSDRPASLGSWQSTAGELAHDYGSAVAAVVRTCAMRGGKTAIAAPGLRWRRATTLSAPVTTGRTQPWRSLD